MANHDKGDKSIHLIHLLPAFNICTADAVCSLQLHFHGNSEEGIRLMKNFIGHFDGGEREKGEISWKAFLCFPAQINLDKSTSP